MPERKRQFANGGEAWRPALRLIQRKAASRIPGYEVGVRRGGEGGQLGCRSTGPGLKGFLFHHGEHHFRGVYGRRRFGVSVIMRGDEGELLRLQRCIDVGETYLLRQLEIVEELRQRGAPSGMAVQLLRALEATLGRHYLALAGLTGLKPAEVLPAA